MRNLLTLFLLSFSLVATAQTFFPVEATVNLTRPSVYPEDLAQPGAVIITVRLADNGPDVPVYLQLSLRDRMGQELVSEVQPSDPIFTLSNMAPLVLTGEDLRPYLEQMGAAAGAMGGTESGVLAEGQVSLCVQFFDGRSFSDPLTERICGSNFVELLEPPVPFLPEGVQIAPPMTALNFNWLGDNLGAGVVRYEVRIWELPDVWANNPDVVINTFPLIGPPAESAVGVRTLTWTNADAPLEEGKTYVYNIRAVDLTGQNRYRNNGFSPHRIFTWQAPPNVLDELCYVPDALAVTGGNNLSWEGEDFADVRYTVTVRELPNLNFISLTEIEPTPTFPTRTEINGGPQVRYNYTMPTMLDTVGRGYVVELCAVCPNTGEQNCREVRYGIPATNGGTSPGNEITQQVSCEFLEEPTLEITVTGPTSSAVNWNFGDSVNVDYTLRWAPEKGRGVGPDSTSLSSETTSYVLEGLLPAATYTVTVCAVCPAGPVCETRTVLTPDYDCPTPDDILTGVTVTSNPPNAIAVNWTNGMPNANPNGWWAYVNDGSGVMVPKNNALSPNSPSGGTTPGGGGGGAPATAADTTFTDLISDTTYVITVCYECTDGTTVCADFEAELSGCDGLELAPQIVGVGFDTARISWNETAENAYTISYVRQGDDAPPTVLDATTNHKTLSDLRPTTTYDVTICAPCGSLEICDTLTLTTTAVSCSQAGEFVYEYECGTEGEIDPLDAGTRVTDLTLGDSIWAGDFLVEVGQIEGAGPAFGGYGFTEVPYLAGAKLKLEFNAVEVNENCRMVAGEMVVSSPVRELLETIDNAISDFIDLVNDIDQFLANMQQALGVFGDIVNDLATQVDQWDQLNDVIDAATEAVTQIPFIPQDLLDDLEDAADCMKDAARQDPNSPGAEQQMADCNEAFQEALAEIQQYVNDLFDAPFRVDFATDPAQSVTYGLDSLRYQAIAENYVVHTINGSEYRVPWISTSTVAGRPGNQLLARRADGGDISEVTFIGTDQAEISGWTASGALARHPGLDAGSDQQVRHVFASIPGDTTGGKPPVRLAGQLSIVTYDPVEVTVHVVPVNGAEIPFGAGDSDALQQQMNAIFHPAVVDLTVVIEPSLSAPDFSDTIQRVDLHPLSNYTPQMLDLRRLIKDQPYHNGRDYYLAVVKNMAPRSREGFMPRKRRFGFLNAAVSTASDRAGFARLAAHELAHGAFHLQHTFDRFQDALEGTTDNLMDYAGGRELYRYQWENVHDPEANFTLFDEEGEGESEGALVKVEALPIYSRDYIWYSNDAVGPLQQPGDLKMYAQAPSGYWVALPPGAIGMFFPDEDGDFPKGCLAGFYLPVSTENYIKGLYLGWYDTENRDFLGYQRSYRDVLENAWKTHAPGYVSGAANTRPQSVYVVYAEGCNVVLEIAETASSPYNPDDPNIIVSTEIFRSLLSNSSVNPNAGPYYGYECVTPEAFCEAAYAFHPYMTDTGPLGQYVRTRPCIIGELVKGDFYYDGDDEWWDNLANIVAIAQALALAPIIIDKIIAAYIQHKIREKAVSAATAAALDLLFQAAFKYYFPGDNQPPEGPDYISWEEAFEDLNYTQAGVSAAQSLLDVNNTALKLALNAAADCASSGLLNSDGTIRESFDASQCLQAAVIGMLIGVTLDVGVPWVRQRLDEIPFTDFVQNIIRALPDSYPAMMQNSIVPIPPDLKTKLIEILKRTSVTTTNGVQDLFGYGVSGNTASRLTSVLPKDLNHPLRRYFTDNDFWAIVRRYLPSEFKDDFLKDMLDGPSSFRSFITNLSSNNLATYARLSGTSLRLEERWYSFIRNLPEGTTVSRNSLSSGGIVEDVLDANGSRIGRVSEAGNFLPDKFFRDLPPGSAPREVGDPINGYQLFESPNGIGYQRVANIDDLSPQDLGFLRSSPDAHTLERHGFDVTDEALLERARTGRTPDGVTSNNGASDASKFNTQDDVIRSLAEIGPNSSAFASRVTSNPQNFTITHTFTGGSSVGRGVIAGGTTFQTTNTVLAYYRRNSAGGYDLITMYPEL